MTTEVIKKSTRFDERGKIKATGTPTSLSTHDLFLLASLFLMEASIATVLLALHIKGERPLEAFLSSRPGLMFLCAVGAFLVGGIAIVREVRAYTRSPSRTLHLTVAMNLITVLLILLAGELAVRANVRNFFQFEALGGNLVLAPKSWEATKHRYRQLIDQAQNYLSFIVHDSHKGWTVGSNRRGGDGLYWSSPEGIRIPHEGASVPRKTGQTDIALVGDSFTFGEEVRYDETYGHYLDEMLGPQFRVLNFVVPGYGLDQMYLRYKQDVREWKPKVVILGFMSQDLERTLWVYPFLGNHTWDYPFAKPRFIVRGEELVNLNTSPLPPHEIISRSSVSELPLLEYQKEYKESEWQQRVLHHSYLVRLLTTWFPSWSSGKAGVSEEDHLSVNASIVKAFAESVSQEGSIPMVVYFPRWEELQEPGTALSSWGMEVLKKGRVARSMLERAGIAYIDPTPCLLEADSPDVLYQPRRHHYSQAGNAAIAKCVRTALSEMLPQAS